jgi:large subunit ribosomal protein L31
MVVKQDTHPNYYTTQIVCGTCGTVWQIGSTKENMRVSICANCHPFYTGEQRQLVDTEGQVDRFMKRLAASQQRQAEAAKRRETKEKKPRKKSLLSEIYGDEDEGQQAAAPEAEASTSSEE